MEVADHPGVWPLVSARGDGVGFSLRSGRVFTLQTSLREGHRSEHALCSAQSLCEEEERT